MPVAKHQASLPEPLLHAKLSRDTFPPVPSLEGLTAAIPVAPLEPSERAWQLSCSLGPPPAPEMAMGTKQHANTPEASAGCSIMQLWAAAALGDTASGST